MVLSGVGKVSDRSAWRAAIWGIRFLQRTALQVERPRKRCRMSNWTVSGVAALEDSLVEYEGEALCLQCLHERLREKICFVAIAAPQEEERYCHFCHRWGKNLFPAVLGGKKPKPSPVPTKPENFSIWPL
jgi:hypothetical protein